MPRGVILNNAISRLRTQNSPFTANSNATITFGMESSLFAGIPPELRNDIWAMLVVRNNNIVAVGPISHAVATSPTHKQQYAFSSLPPIVHTCRQIRQEALSIYYEDNTFHHKLNVPYREGDESNQIGRDITVFNSWLRAIDRKFFPFLRKIKLSVEPCEDDPLDSLFSTLRACRCSRDQIDLEIEFEYRCHRAYQPSDDQVAEFRALRKEELTDVVDELKESYLVVKRKRPAWVIKEA